MHRSSSSQSHWHVPAPPPIATPLTLARTCLTPPPITCMLQATLEMSQWLGLPTDGSTTWPQIVDAVKEKHPDIHNKASEFGQREADK